MELQLVKYALENGGSVHPLIIDAKLTNGTGTFNPSVYDDDGKLKVVIRHCQVTIYHSELNRFEHEWGPLAYMNPDNDLRLATTNYIGELNDKLELVNVKKLELLELHKAVWEFHGLEDCRLFRWLGRLYVCGVRRDVKPNGEGRMELSELNGHKELNRFRIPVPNGDASYCEKNWVPVLSLPHHFVKWTNPTEVVKVDATAGTCETVFHGGEPDQSIVKRMHRQFPNLHVSGDIRGGSQVVRRGDRYYMVGHVSHLFQTEVGRTKGTWPSGKNSIYRHVLVSWDLNWGDMQVSEQFNFMNTMIEFCAGLAFVGDDAYISFGVQDNAAYLLKLPIDALLNLQ
jgi:predicted GH43/DUF377 family glycosyl hydrolase